MMGKYVRIRKQMTAFLAAGLVFAATAMPALAAPTISHVDYEGRGKVEVNFDGKVSYQNLKVVVKDQEGKRYQTRIVDQDNDDLEFVIENFKSDTSYSYVIKGIKSRGEAKYSSLKGKVTIPAAKKISLKKIKVDAKDREVEFQFITHVKWKNPSIVITDDKGKKLSATIREMDSDELEVAVPGLKKGKTYHYQIKGIRSVDAKSYRSIKGSF